MTHPAIMQDWSRGLLVGLVPTLSMLTGSLLLMKYEVHRLTEACFQFFSAGLILAAVAGELFPLAVEFDDKAVTIKGMSLGFIGCLAFIHGVDYIIHSLHQSNDEQHQMDQYKYQSIPEEENWDMHPVQASVDAINTVSHRKKIKLDLKLMLSIVDRILQSTNHLILEEGRLSLDEESMAEEIDADIHGLQYIVDRTRRQLEASNFGLHIQNGLSQLTGMAWNDSFARMIIL